MRPGRAALVLSVLPAAIPLASSIAQAGPSRLVLDAADAAPAPPLVGRAQTRDGIVDLTRDAFAEGGPAFELAPAVARVMAEAAEAVERADDGARHDPLDPARR
ncbi:MAG: hypothetical protein ABW252_24930 [Polyangiales bacterium]